MNAYGKASLGHLSKVLRAWDQFLVEYSTLDSGAAFDLRGDPPQFIRLLNREVATLCGDLGIEIDNEPPGGIPT